jgi:hypothetical protein
VQVRASENSDMGATAMYVLKTLKTLEAGTHRWA